MLNTRTKTAVTRLVTRTLALAKGGNTSEEYEDAFLMSKGFAGRPPRAAFAVADGATESLLSGKWAALLVRRFVESWQECDKLDEWLGETTHAWQDEKSDYLKQRERDNKPVQWYEEPGLEAGAFAALLGVELKPQAPEGGAVYGLDWRASAVGDCCLFQVRAGELMCAFPLDSADAFNSRPFLLSSNPARNKGITERFQFAEGEAQVGDSFYLMSDALAQWFVRAYERGGAPWQALEPFRAAHTENEFARWIAAQRAEHLMRNDDVTLVSFEIN